MLHSWVLSRGFSQRVSQRLPCHPSFPLFWLKSKVLKVGAALALRRAAAAGGAVHWALPWGSA